MCDTGTTQNRQIASGRCPRASVRTASVVASSRNGLAAKGWQLRAGGAAAGGHARNGTTSTGELPGHRTEGSMPPRHQSREGGVQ